MVSQDVESARTLQNPGFPWSRWKSLHGERNLKAGLSTVLILPPPAMSPDATTKVDKRRQRDELRVTAIRDFPDQRERIGRNLFFSHFTEIECTIRARLRDRGLPCDEQNPHYNDIFDYVVQQIYHPKALPGAVEKFDSDRGGLDNWLLTRVADKVSDRIRKHARNPRESTALLCDAVATRTSAGLVGAGDFDEILGRLTALERASMALLLVLVRDLDQRDQEAIHKVSGKTRQQIETSVASLRESSHAEQHLGQREAELLGQVSRCNALLRWFAARAQRFRSLMETSDVPATVISGIVARAESGEQTQQQIRNRHAADDRAGAQEREAARMRREFELACHNSGRMRRRLQTLNHEIRKLPAVPLVPHEWIAEILGRVRNQVTSTIHRARERLKKSAFLEPATEHSC